MQASYRLQNTLARGAALTLLAYVLFTLLFQARDMWAVPSVLAPGRNLIADIAYALLPDIWLNATWASDIAVWVRIAYLALLLFAFAAYVWTARRAYNGWFHTPGSSRKALWIIMLVAAVALLLLLSGRTMLSTDVYSYVWYGRIAALEGGNPFVNPPMSYAGVDTTGWMAMEAWQGQLPSVYGSVWIWFAAGVSYIAQAFADKDLAANVLGHRLLSDAAHIVNIWLIWRVAAVFAGRTIKDGNDPEEASRKRTALQVGAAVTYAWNPLMLIEFGLSAHNDSLMIAFLLISVWLLLEGRWRWAALALAAASLIKMLALIFLPFFLIWVWRIPTAAKPVGNKSTSVQSQGGKHGVVNVAQALGILGLAWIVTMWPYGGPLVLLDVVSENPGAMGQRNSIASTILIGIPTTLYNMDWLTQQAASLPGYFGGALHKAISMWVRLGLEAIAGLLILLAFRRTWKATEKEPASALSGWAWAMIVYYMVGALWFWPWYVSWLFIPLVLVGPGRLWNTGQILAASSMAIYTAFPPLAGPDRELVFEHYTGLVMFLPPAAYLLWTEWSRRRSENKGVSKREEAHAQARNAAASRSQPNTR